MKKIIIGCILLAMGLAANARTHKDAVTDQMWFLPAGSVQLTNCLDHDIRNSMEHWNKGDLPYAKLVKMYRNGRTQFGLGEMWGKAVRSGSLFYRYTHDSKLKEILKSTMADAMTTLRSNGILACVPPEQQPDGKNGDLWERKYIMLGLYQYYKDVEQDPRVLRVLIAEGNSIVDQIGDAPKTDLQSQGWSHNGIESSTIFEPVMLLYRMTGDKKYLDFAGYIIKKGGCRGADLFKQSRDNVRPRLMGDGYPKAYEMLSLFEGLAEYYRATGDSQARLALLNLFENIKKYEITLIGNGGADQPYYPQWSGEAWDDTALEQANPNIKRMMETCTGVTWMKLCSQIVRLTGDASAVEYIEKYVYNGLIGAMKPGGNGFSYVNLLNGQKVTDQGWGWNFDGFPITCCNLNGPIGLGFIPLVAVMQSKEGPVVNLYNAGLFKAKTQKGHPVTLTLDGKFPIGNEVSIAFDLRKAEQFTLKLRIPSWSEKTVVKVNGVPVNNVVPGSYLSLSRRWQTGDRLTITFDMRCRLITAPHGSDTTAWNSQAVQYGPIVLSRDENTDRNFNKPVSILADGQGIIAAKQTKPTLSSTRMEFLIPTTEGTIHMIDYASVNGWNGKHICTWLPGINAH